MAEINILNLQPTTISRDLSGKFILLYGPEKSGKTTFSSKMDKPLILTFERGTNGLPGVYAQEINKWTDFKKVCSQLRSDRAKEQYKTIVIDTLGVAADMAEQYILQQKGIDSLSDAGYGAGWSAYKKEMESTFRELTYLGYAIVFIAHSTLRKTMYKDGQGEDIYSFYPDLNKNAMSIANKLVDLIVFLSVEFDANQKAVRTLHLRQTPYIFAGSRYAYIKDKVEYGYQNLVDAISDAINQEIERGAVEGTTTDTLPEERSFSDALNEARQLWNALNCNDNLVNAQKVNALVKQHLGRDAKISEITPAQQDILEIIIYDMKALL